MLHLMWCPTMDYGMRIHQINWRLFIHNNVESNAVTEFLGMLVSFQSRTGTRLENPSSASLASCPVVGVTVWGRDYNHTYFNMASFRYLSRKQLEGFGKYKVRIIINSSMLNAHTSIAQWKTILCQYTFYSPGGVTSSRYIICYCGGVIYCYISAVPVMDCS